MFKKFSDFMFFPLWTLNLFQQCISPISTLFVPYTSETQHSYPYKGKVWQNM